MVYNAYTCNLLLILFTSYIQTYLPLLHFAIAELHFADVAFFFPHKLKVCDGPEWSKSVGAILTIIVIHFIICVSHFLVILGTFSDFFIIICYGDQ